MNSQSVVLTNTSNCKGPLLTSKARQEPYLKGHVWVILWSCHVCVLIQDRQAK